MQAKLFGSSLYGIDAFRVTIEVSVEKGLGIMITGLPDDGIKESYSRIAVALNTHGFQMPRTKLVINLAPADVRKTGTAFDLPIAIALLLASEQIVDLGKLKDYVIAGELGLDGTLHPVRGSLCMAHQAMKDGFKGIILPQVNANEASLVTGIDVYGLTGLDDVIEFIQSDFAIEPHEYHSIHYLSQKQYDFAQVKGQEPVKRALQIAAAGGHNAILIGPPGIGKTMLAKRLPTILPEMTKEESLETTRIYSVANNVMPHSGLITERPFRNPHHTSSDIALIGGGSFPVPGEVSLAHNGVLFLDELAEFKRNVIEALRQPMEDRKVLISRAKMSLQFPSSFMLLAAMNPCLCGYLNHPTIKCSCSKRAIWWYNRKLSGPLNERIDLHITVEPVPLSELINMEPDGELSSVIRARVTKARVLQSKRFADFPGIHCNAQMHDSDIDKFCQLEEAAKRFLYKQVDKLQLSPRTYTRILKVARTIADLYGTKLIEMAHVAEAIHFRSPDKPLLQQHPTKQSHPNHFL